MQFPASPRLDFKTREQATYDSIRQAIVEGCWGPDEPVVVSRISADLGVSRITVANALKRLAAEGFVRMTPHKEAVVARLDREGVREIYLIRAELEALAAAEAAVRISPAEIEEARRLNEIVRQQRAELPAIRAFRAADRAFHRHVRKAANMPRLDRLLENLADQCEYCRSRLLDPGRLSPPNPDAHETLLALLAEHDADAASRLMRDHVLAGMRTVLATLGQTE